MNKQEKDKFIEEFARRWNEKLTKFTTTEDDERKVYVGWFNLRHMLKIFLTAYKRKIKQ